MDFINLRTFLLGIISDFELFGLESLLLCNSLTENHISQPYYPLAQSQFDLLPPEVLLQNLFREKRVFLTLVRESPGI